MGKLEAKLPVENSPSVTHLCLYETGHLVEENQGHWIEVKVNRHIKEAEALVNDPENFVDESTVLQESNLVAERLSKLVFLI